ncbi:unnamed protein product [Musa acuminata subsp. malaccensis]|uniref:(wild Malaysian banana) hypothetical protein n=1 Tax=Musa acuminata subsp. malaccensis TaxID=214687 RepID=A0A8D7FN51_MUSAM|nr:unnamed protein product [Musa acuminata subsp. malaccensis]
MEIPYQEKFLLLDPSPSPDPPHGYRPLNQIYLPLCCKLIASCGPIESPNGRGSRCPGGAETHRGTAVAPPLDPN